MQKKYFSSLVALGAALLLALVVFFSGTLHLAKAPDSLQFIASDSPAQMQTADFTVQLGSKVHSAAVQAELWQNGECSPSEAFILSGNAKELHIFTAIDGFGDFYAPTISVQIHAGDDAPSLLQEYTLPKSAVGWSFTSYTDGETIEAVPGEDAILAAWAFDLGSGVRSYACRELTPQELGSAPCLLVIRAKFQS